MTAEDSVIRQFIAHEGVELSVNALASLTKMPSNTVRVSLSRIIKRNKLNNLVRTSRGRYTFKPNDAPRNTKHPLTGLIGCLNRMIRWD